jgi:hypothetical protein
MCQPDENLSALPFVNLLNVIIHVWLEIVHAAFPPQKLPRQDADIAVPHMHILQDFYSSRACNHHVGTLLQCSMCIIILVPQLQVSHHVQ